jgi:hypothetical protein
MTWINTDTNEDASNSSIQFWESLRIALKNEGFWADKIKELRGEPTKRLKMALDNLPLPAAFREGAVATRALIREKRKQKKELPALLDTPASRSPIDRTADAPC